MASAERKRAVRAQAKREAQSERDNKLATALAYPPTADGVIRWAEENLIVPTGKLAGTYFEIQPWQREWFEAVLARDGDSPQYYTVAISCPRKTGKSSLLAIYLAAVCAGPLCTRDNIRIGCISLSQDLCKEIKLMVVEILTASGLEDLIDA